MKAWIVDDPIEAATERIKRMPSAELSTNLAEVGTDCISRQAAIDVATSVTMEWDGMYVQDLNVRIREAIEQLPPVNNSEKPNSSDTISRQMLLEYIHGEPVGRLLCDKYNLDGLIEQFPSAEPKTGGWVKLDMHRGMADHKCSVCEQECYVPTCMGEPMYAYCPNCGAMMKGEQE